jgi:hypothetical protein
MTRALQTFALGSLLFTSPAFAYDEYEDGDDDDLVMQVEAEIFTGIMGIGDMPPDLESVALLGYGVLLGLVDPESFFGIAMRFDAQFGLGTGEASLFRVAMDFSFQKHFEVIDNRDFIQLGVGPSFGFDTLSIPCTTMCTPEQQALGDALFKHDSAALGAHLELGFTHVLEETIFMGAEVRGRLLHALREGAAPARYETSFVLRFGTFIEL